MRLPYIKMFIFSVYQSKPVTVKAAVFITETASSNAILLTFIERKLSFAYYILISWRTFVTMRTRNHFSHQQNQQTYQNNLHYE